MKMLTSWVVLAAATFVLSACAGSHRALASPDSPRREAFSLVGGLSVPVPPGFRWRSWSHGVAISDGPVGLGSSSAPLTAGYLPQNPNRVALSVFQGVFHGPTPTKQLPVTLHDLSRASGGLTLWGGAFLIHKRAYGFQIWLGRNAPATDRSTVLSALQAVKLR